MYICECGEVFEEPERTRGDSYEFCGATGYIDNYVCPVCGSEHYYEAKQCEGCGEYFAEDDLKEGFCEYCWQFAETVEEVMMNENTEAQQG